MTATANGAAHPVSRWGANPSMVDFMNGEFESFVAPEVGYRLAALTDGEGCFFIAKSCCVFLIKMRADDRPFLERIRAEVGSPGRIRTQQPSGGGNRSPFSVWTIQTRREVLWLTKVFDAFPLWSKKARDYEVWREAVIAWYADGSPAQLPAYAERLREVRKYRDLNAAEGSVPSP